MHNKPKVAKSDRSTPKITSWPPDNKSGGRMVRHLGEQVAPDTEVAENMLSRLFKEEEKGGFSGRQLAL